MLGVGVVMLERGLHMYVLDHESYILPMDGRIPDSDHISVIYMLPPSRSHMCRVAVAIRTA